MRFISIEQILTLVTLFMFLSSSITLAIEPSIKKIGILKNYANIDTKIKIPAVGRSDYYQTIQL